MRASAAGIGVCIFVRTNFFSDVPLYDVSSVDLPGGGSGRTIADIRTLDPRPLRATRLSFTASAISWGGYSVGIENRCGRKTHFWNACRNATDATPK